jgi:hypothetical protein
MMAFTDAKALFTHHQIPGDLAFTKFDADFDQQHPTMVGPQLAMPMYPYDVVDDRPADQFIFNEYVWDPPMVEAGGSLAFFGPLDATNQHCSDPDMHVSNNFQVHMVDAATMTSFETGDSPPFSCKSPNSSQLSAASVSSASSLDQNRARKPSRKLKQQQNVQNEPQPLPFRPCQQEKEQAQLPAPPRLPAKAAKLSRSTKQPRQTKKSRVSKPIIVESEAEKLDDPTRSKFLERNRIAASKCRQKKKLWMQELEDVKADLEKSYWDLQGNYNSFFEEVSQLKNQLMVHSGCHNFNIDKWIEREARRFVDTATPLRTTAVDQPPNQESTSCNPTQYSFSGEPSSLLPLLGCDVSYATYPSQNRLVSFLPQ